MEKISGIVPASRRVQGVNLKDSQPVRPGVPTFGRPIGVSTLAQGGPTTAEKAVAAHNELMARRSGDAHKPQIIEDMADKFFLKNQQAAGGPAEDFDLNYNLDIGPTTMPSESFDDILVPEANPGLELAAGPSIEERVMMAEADAEAYDYTPPCTYLDVKA